MAQTGKGSGGGTGNRPGCDGRRTTGYRIDRSTSSSHWRSPWGRDSRGGSPEGMKEETQEGRDVKGIKRVS